MFIKDWYSEMLHQILKSGLWVPEPEKGTGIDSMVRYPQTRVPVTGLFTQMNLSMEDVHVQTIYLITYVHLNPTI